MTEQLCGYCGFPIHRDHAKRYLGVYAAHKESVCHQLWQAETERLKALNAELATLALEAMKRRPAFNPKTRQRVIKAANDALAQGENDG